MNFVTDVSDTPCIAFEGGRWLLYTERNIPAGEDGPERDVLTYEVLEAKTAEDALVEAAEWLDREPDEINVVRSQ